MATGAEATSRFGNGVANASVGVASAGICVGGVRLLFEVNVFNQNYPTLPSRKGPGKLGSVVDVISGSSFLLGRNGNGHVLIDIRENG